MTRKEIFKLKMSLLRIWFFKNFVVFLQAAMYILILAILTGRIGNDAFILNLVGLDNFSVAIDDTLVNDFSIGTMLINLVYVFSSAIVVIGTVSTKSKQLVLSDIKKSSTKMMLLRAGLYFNKDGKLVKRIEEVTKIDLDGDNMIGNTGEEVTDFPNENIFKGLKRTGEEFITIVTLKPESTADADAFIEENDMVGTAEAINNFNDLGIEVEDVLAFSQSEDGEALKAKINDIAESTLPVIRRRAKSSGKIFVKIGSGVKTGTFATGRFFKYVGRSVGSVFSASGKSILHFGTSISGFVINTVKSLGSTVKGIFVKENMADDDEIAQVLGGKLEQPESVKVVEVKAIAKSKVAVKSVITPVKTVVRSTRKPMTATELQLEKLRKKYGQ